MTKKLLILLVVLWSCAGCGGGGTSTAARVYPDQAVSNANFPKSLTFSSQPVDTLVNQVIPPVQVGVLDSIGEQTVFDPVVQIALGDNPGNATLTGTLTVTAVNGTATFSDLRIDAPGGGYTLVVTALNLESASSGGFNVTAEGPPSELVFVTAPPNGAPGAVLAPPVQVAVQDVNGTILAGQVTGVTISLASNPQNATLGGTLSVNTVNGIATFPDLTIDQAGTYTLEVSTASGVTVTSGEFQVQ